ncbi:hypothetical protein EalM132_00153 [Exiguobacterium phage vB_EalM-132]|nr:hypothetical protein EalM132_00153 [Exiguobacterium phage vB_EalM-132]
MLLAGLIGSVATLGVSVLVIDSIISRTVRKIVNTDANTYESKALRFKLILLHKASFVLNMLSVAGALVLVMLFALGM